MNTAALPAPADLLEEPRRRATDAIRDLAIAILQNTSPGYAFVEAKKICEIGHTLVRAQAKRVEDLGNAQGDGEYGMNIVNGNNFVMPALRPINNVAPLDQNEIFRNILHATIPQAQMTTEARRAEIAQTEASEIATLNDLLETADDAQKLILKHRIQVLMQRMETRNHVEPALVPAHDVGGPLAREDRTEGDEPAGVRADPLGGEGDRGIAHACREADVGPVAVGHGG